MSNRPRLVTALKVAAVIIAIIAGTRIIGILGKCGPLGCGANGDSFDERMAVLSKTDPMLVKYREVKMVKTGFRRARGIAVAKDGRFYVVGDRAVASFSKDGTRRDLVGLDGEPTCIAVAPNGTVYIGMRDSVVMCDLAKKSGLVLSQVEGTGWASLGRNAYVTSISVGKDAVWVADAGDRVVLKYSLAGQVIAMVGKKDPQKRAPGLVIPSPHLDVVAADKDSVWVSNPGTHELELYGSDGSLKKAWGKASFAIDGFSGCCNPTDFALLPDGRFITSEKGLPRVKVFRANGRFEGVVAGFESFAPDVVGLDVATDAGGRVFVLDPAQGMVRIFVPKDKVKP